MRTRRRHYKSSLLASLDNKTSLALVKSSGVESSLTTVTRATTGTLPDFEGLIRTAKSGEIRLAGARRVANLVATNLDAWVKTAAGTGATATSSATSVAGALEQAYQITLNRGAGNTSSDSSTLTMTISGGVSGNRYVFSFRVKGVAGEQVAIRGAAGSTYTIHTFTGNWDRLSTNEIGSATPQVSFASRGTITTTNSVTFYAEMPMVEDVTGQANQNPSEYVSNSNGIPTGSNIITNGYFSSGTTGWSAASAFSSTAVVTLGELIVTPSVNFGRQITSFPTEIGKVYRVFGNVRRASGSTGSAYIAQTTSTGSDLTTFGNITSSTSTLVTGNFTATATTSYISCAVTSTADTGGFDNIFVSPAIYHGAGADGVAYFDYQNGNTVSSNVVTEAQGAAIAESSFLGALVEPVRTQLYLNSATLVTQNNTVTAQAYTASFYGTGTITFSGAYVGSLIGTGANNRVSLTFTPSAGTLTSTVSGSCTRAQLEAGSYFSSYIASVGASVTRNADIETIPTANFNTRIGKLSIEFTPTHASVGTVALGGSYVDANNYTQILHIAATGWVFRKRVAGVDYDAVLSGEFVANTTYKIVVSWSDTAGIDIFIDGVKGVNHTNTLPLQLGSVWQIGSDGNSLQQATGYFKNVIARKNNNQTVILANTSTPLSPSFDFTTALNLTQLQITGFL